MCWAKNLKISGMPCVMMLPWSAPAMTLCSYFMFSSLALAAHCSEMLGGTRVLPFRESRAQGECRGSHRRDGGPVGGVFGGNVKGPRAAHGVAGEVRAALIDVVVLADDGQDVHDVLFTEGEEAPWVTAVPPLGTRVRVLRRRPAGFRVG